MTAAQYNGWLAVAERHSRVRAEAEDLLHDALLAAAAADRTDLDDEANRRWLTGVIRKQAAFRARSAVRQRQREAVVASTRQDVGPGLAEPPLDALRLPEMPRSARVVLALALHGLRRDEICAVLGLSPTAFRQRLVTLRRALAPFSDDAQRETLALAHARRQSRGNDLALGLLRRALLARARTAPGLGTHDPDGHLLGLGS